MTPGVFARYDYNHMLPVPNIVKPAGKEVSVG